MEREWRSWFLPLNSHHSDVPLAPALTCFVFFFFSIMAFLDPELCQEVTLGWWSKFYLLDFIKGLSRTEIS